MRFRQGTGAFFSSESPVPPFGAVFEEDEGVAYLYACNLADSSPGILDAVLIYEVNSLSVPMRDSEAEIVWSSDGLKAGLLLDQRLEAAIDFESRTAACRANFPPASGPWAAQGRPSWNDSFSDLFGSPHVG